MIASGNVKKITVFKIDFHFLISFSLFLFRFFTSSLFNQIKQKGIAPLLSHAIRLTRQWMPGYWLAREVLTKSLVSVSRLVQTLARRMLGMMPNLQANFR